MANDGAYVALGLKVWKAQIERADKLFGSLSSEEVLREIAPGRNRLLYLWGHLTAVHDAMLPLLGLGERFHPEFDVAFVSNPDKSQTAIPSHEQVRQAWKTVNGELWKGFERMSWSDWLPAAHGCIGRRFRERHFAQSLRHPAEPHQPSVLSPRPGGARTQVTEREAWEGLESSSSATKEKTVSKRTRWQVEIIVNMSQKSARGDSQSHAALAHWLAERVFRVLGDRQPHQTNTLFGVDALWGRHDPSRDLARTIPALAATRPSRQKIKPE